MLTAQQIVPREMWSASFYTAEFYPQSPRGHLGAIVDSPAREFKIHLQGWDVASETYFTFWDEAIADAASRVLTFTDLPILFPPTGTYRLLLMSRMRVYVELTSGGSPRNLTLSMLWSDATSGAAVGD